MKKLPTTKTAIYTADGQTKSKSITVAFAPPYSQTDIFDGSATNTLPVVFVAESEVESPEKGDTYLIESVTYYAQKIVPNGVGMNVVMLSKKAAHG